jgi:hypothetical protein
MKVITVSEFWSDIGGYIPENCPPERWAMMRNDRENIALRVWKEKALDANPYYPSNKALRSCIHAVREIIKKSGPYPCTGEALAAISRLEEHIGSRPLNCPQPLVRDFAYFTTHHIIAITRFAGGHRSPILNDVEIDLSVAPMPG